MEQNFSQNKLPAPDLVILLQKGSLLSFVMLYINEYIPIYRQSQRCALSFSASTMLSRVVFATRILLPPPFSS